MAIEKPEDTTPAHDGVSVEEDSATIRHGLVFKDDRVVAISNLDVDGNGDQNLFYQDSRRNQQSGDAETIADKITKKYETAPVEEQLCAALVAEEEVIRQQLNEAKAELAVKILETLEDPKRCLQIALVMKETVALTNAISKRQQNAVAVLVSIRAQRLLLERQLRGADGR